MHQISRGRRRLAVTVIAAAIAVPGVTPATTALAQQPANVVGVSVGDQGDSVRSVQKALIEQGFMSGVADGVFGSGTEWALKRLQAYHGIRQTGVVGPATAIALGIERNVVFGLAEGDRGDRVRALQQALKNQGLDIGASGVDGVFGPSTTAAVREFQRRQGYLTTGKVNASTAAKLGDVAIPKAAAPAPKQEAPAKQPGPAASTESSSGGDRSAGIEGLAIGARGDAVARVQRALIAAGQTVVGGADGIYGALTAAAVRSFQRANGIGETGRVDAVTAKAIRAAERTSGSPSTSAPAAKAPGIRGLAIGARGEAVARVQRALMNAGFTVVGGADGIYGALTAAAVQSFQGVNGIEVSGRVDAATAQAIQAIERSAGREPAGRSPTSSSPMVGLKYGARGSDVAALQQALIGAGHRPAGGADGIFGPATRGALEAFQAAQGLKVTGQADAATVKKLSSGPSASSSMIGLRAGALGSVVVELQTALEQAGHRPRGGADGIFGPATAQALKNFQSGRGIDATGVVDQATATALRNPSSARSAARSPASAGGFAAFGEKGQRVIALQTALVSAGLQFRGGVDGSFGGSTAGAVMEFQRRNGLAVTGRVDSATAAALRLGSAPAPKAPDASNVKLHAFPMQGPCHFSDTWMWPRGGGRVHLGVDIIGAEGLELYAVAPGTVTKVYRDRPGSLSGNGLRIEQPDGTYFFYAHLLELAKGIKVGSKVKAGQVVGLNGSTGSSGTPHLHLEIHPKGGAAINPYPLVKAIDAC